MSPERWERLHALCERAVGLSPEERASFLARECADDPALAAEVERYLHSSVSPNFLRVPLLDQITLFGRDFTGHAFGDFLVEKELGRGGSGVVYLAKQSSLDRSVALKLTPAKRDERSQQRFEREIAAAAKLDHPRIIPVYVSGITDDSAWYAMRYVPGWDLAEELRRQDERRKSSSQKPIAWPPFDAADYIAHAAEKVAELAEALAYAHEHGVIHRDVKPHNILLDAQGTPFLTDFGLARDERFGSLTATNIVQGTPYYMSLEQVEARKKSVDHRTDIYSLGVVLYQILSLRVPFEGRTQEEVFHQIATREAPALSRANSRVPRDLVVVVEKAMGKRAEWRYATAREFAEDLRRFLRHEAVVARPPGFADRMRRWADRHKLPLVIVSAIVMASFLGFFASASREAERQEALFLKKLRPLIFGSAKDLSPGELAEINRVLHEAESGRNRSSVFLGSLAVVRAKLESDAEERTRDLAALRKRAFRDGDESGAGFDLAPNEIALQDYLVAARDAHSIYQSSQFQEQSKVESTWPRIEVFLRSGHPEVPGISDAVVAIREIDDLASERLPLRTLGLLRDREFRVSPGYYFITVIVPGFGHAEVARYIRRQELPHLISVSLSDDRTATTGMKLMPACLMKINRRSALGCLTAGDSVVVADFFVDEAEVSNGEFEDYMRESGAAPPVLWTDLGYGKDGEPGREWERLIAPRASEWRELPVVGLSVLAARAFAEWHGKSLPLHHEAHRYMQGPEGWYAPCHVPGSDPIAPDAPGMARMTIGRPLPSREASWEDRFRIYLQQVEPVRADGYAHPPGGLFHAFGNVWELTLSHVVEDQDGILVATPYTALALGSDWGARPHVQDKLCRDWSSHFIRGVGESYRSETVGFRCVRRIL